MMNKKIMAYLNWKDNFVNLGIALFVVMFGFFFLLYSTGVNKYKRTNLEIMIQTERLALAKELLNGAADVKIAADLIEQNELSSVIDEVTNTGDSMGIEFLSIEAKSIKSKRKDPYQVLPIHMSFRSGYEQIGLFLAALRNLNNGMVTVERFEIIKNEHIAPRLETEVVAVVYLKNENDK